ncbi:hypothetical protein [Pseudomonas sp. UBA6562]|uniref:hypothetical protein n=1 Tax=Pseudomonas sp. UBA6562 TaxID=1947332 RepID=UPI0025E90244|nr:hypothetical protein [Pseudomonas sp. UBA6562]
MSPLPDIDDINPLQIEPDEQVALYLEGLEPLLMTADEQRAAALVQQAQAAIESFYGGLDPALRARMTLLYQTPGASVEALGAIVQATRDRIADALSARVGRALALDDVRLHTARPQAAATSGRLWDWLARGTPIQLAAPRLTRDAIEFVAQSWLTIDGAPLTGRDGQPLGVGEVVELGRELDIGQSIARQCDAWAADSRTREAVRREGDARFELALLHALKAKRIDLEQYLHIKAAAGLSLPAAFDVAFMQPRGEGATLHFQLRIEGHDLPAFAMKVAGQVYVMADTYPEARLFAADSAAGMTAMEVFGAALREDLWEGRAQREGWAWWLLSPAARDAVAARMPQPLPAANQYPAQAYWAPGGVYASREAYERRAHGVRLTAPYPLHRRSVAQAWADAHVTWLVRRVKERFIANQDSSLAHVQRIGAQWLSMVLDVLLIPVPGHVRFPGRALLFKALFAKQLAVDLPLDLVQARWAEAGATLVDFFETVLEMQASRKAGRLLKARIDTLSRQFARGRLPDPDPTSSVPAPHPLRPLLPVSLAGLNDALLQQALDRANVELRALKAMHQGKAAMDMALVAAVGEVRNRLWGEQTLTLLATEQYTHLPEPVEWVVVACLASSLRMRIAVHDRSGAPLREFETPEGQVAQARLIRHGRWQYAPSTDESPQIAIDSLFLHVHAYRYPTEAAANRPRLAIDLRHAIAAQLREGQGPYHLARALHHGHRLRASVPIDEGRLLAVRVDGSDEPPRGSLRGADTRSVSQECEQRVPEPDSLPNLAKARRQADLAALAGAPGSAGRQTLTQQAQTLYFQGLMNLLAERGLGEAIAIKLKGGRHSISVWGNPEASQVVVLQRRGQSGAYSYLGEPAEREVLAPAADSTVPLSDLLLRLLDDKARDALAINLGDALGLNEAVLQRLPLPDARALAEGDLLGVSIQADAQFLACVQAQALPERPAQNGLIEHEGAQWLQWGLGAIAVVREGAAWRAQSPKAGQGPLLVRQYGEWRRLQEPLAALEQLVAGPVAGAALLARLSALYRQDPLARVYHDTLGAANAGAGGASYIALRGQPTRFYRIKPAEASASEFEVVRPAGTGGGVWLRQDEAGLWQLARTLPGGMDNDEAELWRPWARPGSQLLPHTLGLAGSTYEQFININTGPHKAANQFYPFVRPFSRKAHFKRLLAQAPEAIRAPTDSTNIKAKVELFHREWALPVDLTALPFFHMPGEVASELRHVNGALIAQLVTAKVAERPLITRVIEPMSGSGCYTNFIRVCGFQGQILANDINPLVTLTQREIVQQPDAVQRHIEAIKQDLVEFWQARHAPAFDPQSLRATFADAEAATAFVNSPEVKRFREDIRHYFFSTVETQYTLVNGQIEISAHSSFRADPVNGEASARAFIAAAFYIIQNNSARNNTPVKINELGRLDMPMSTIVREGRNVVLLLAKGLSNLAGLHYQSYLHQGEQGQTLFSTGNGWEMLRVVSGQSNLGDLAIISGHFSDLHLDEITFMDRVDEYAMPFVRNRGRVIIINAYSPFKERAFIELGLRVFVLENRTNGFLLAMSDAVARDAGLPNG